MRQAVSPKELPHKELNFGEGRTTLLLNGIDWSRTQWGFGYDRNTNWEFSESVGTAIPGPRLSLLVGMQHSYARLNTWLPKGSSHSYCQPVNVKLCCDNGKDTIATGDSNTKGDPLSTEQFKLNLVWRRRYANTGCCSLGFGIDGNRLKVEYYILARFIAITWTLYCRLRTSYTNS